MGRTQITSDKRTSSHSKRGVFAIKAEPCPSCRHHKILTGSGPRRCAKCKKNLKKVN